MEEIVTGFEAKLRAALYGGCGVLLLAMFGDAGTAWAMQITLWLMLGFILVKALGSVSRPCPDEIERWLKEQLYGSATAVFAALAYGSGRNLLELGLFDVSSNARMRLIFITASTATVMIGSKMVALLAESGAHHSGRPP